MKKYAIITPVYQQTLQGAERRRLLITIHNNPHAEHIFVSPKILNIERIQKEFPKSRWIRFPNHHFESINSYSKLLLLSSFYKYFTEYEYIVISQLDAVLIRELTDEVFKDYDYVGAAWMDELNAFSIGNRIFLNNGKYKFLPNRSFSVGNGGLSIRKTSSLITITEKIQNPTLKMLGLGTNIGLNEDVVLSYFAMKYGFSVPDRTEASQIFIEQFRPEPFDLWSVYGYHAIEKMYPLFEREIFQKYLLLRIIDDID
jgi:hypothetical protein